MKLHITVTRDGQPEDVTLIPSHSFLLQVTRRAREKILEEMKRKGCVCSRCHVICRSDELSDGVCLVGSGCSVDVDVDMMHPAQSKEELHAQEILPHRLFNVFIDTLPRPGERPQMPPVGGPW